jgi:selenophosphate synthetase-related protein
MDECYHPAMHQTGAVHALPPVSELVAHLRAAPAWQRKRDLQLLSRGTLRLPDDVGDDAVALPDGDGYLLLAAEVMWPPFVALEPELAGRNAVLANANDIYAMGGRPIALLDTLLAPGVAEADAVMRGIAAGAVRYGVPVLGGHLTLEAEVTSLAAFIVGRAHRLLSGRAATAGDVLLLLTAGEGRFHERFPFWDCSLDRSDADLRRDLELLPEIAEAGLCDAARDVSMPGVLGSALQFLEGSGVGAEIDLRALPYPAAARGREELWLQSFPSYAFLLAVEGTVVEEVVARATARNRVCASIGRVTAEPRVELIDGSARACLWNFAAEPFSGFGRPAL